MLRPRRGALALILFLISLAAVALGPAAVRAQDARPRDKAGDQDVPPPARVYVPFEDLKKVFETEGQGVFVPYAEFRALWKKAMDRGPDAVAPSGVTTAAYDGTIEGELAVVKASLEVLSAEDGESAVPIGLGAAVIGEATLDGKPAILVTEKSGRRVVVRGKGVHKLELTLVAPVTPKDGDRTVAFPSAGAPVSRLTFAVPGEGVRVTVSPNLATTRTDEGSGVTRVMAYVGAAPEITLTWRPRPVETAGTAAVVHAQTEVLHVIGEQTVVTRLFVRFTILRGGQRRFRVVTPATDKVLEVEGAAIRSWGETVEGDLRTVSVELHDDAVNSYDLRLLLERPRVAGEATAELPAPSFPDAARDAGTVAVMVLPPIAVRPATVEGLYRVPTGDLSGWMQSSNPALAPGQTVLAWRYAGAGRRLSVSVETVAPEVSVVERSVLDLAPGVAELRAALDLGVERAGLFQTTVSIPDGWELESAQASVDGGLRALDARVEGEGAERRVVLDLGTRRSGSVPLLMTLRRALSLGDADTKLALPVVAVQGAARARGLFVVVADEALDVRTGTVSGFVPAEPELLDTTPLPQPATAPTQPRTMLFGFRHAGEARSGELAIVRRKPLVTAEAVTVAGVEEDRLHVRHVLRFSVRYAGVDTFRFTLPTSVADKVRIEGSAIKERSKAADPDDAAITVHTVVLQSPALGDVVLRVEYDLPQEPLAVGGARKLDVPALGVVGVEREQGWYAVTRDPALSVEGTVDGLQYADAREVPAWAGASDAFLAWRRVRSPHTLTLSVAKHEPVPILQAVVNALALDTLVGGGAVALTEARMDVQVNGLQYLRVELPPGATVEFAEVDGRSISPRREGDVLLLPCPAGKSRDDRFGVRLVYREAAEEASGRWFTVDLVAPRIPDALVQATAWTTWVPQDAVLFSGGGNLRPADYGGVLGAVLGQLAELFGARRAKGQPTTRGGALPPEVTLAVDVRSAYSFQRTGESAHLSARFLPRTATGMLAALAGLAVLALGWWLARRGLRLCTSALGALCIALVPFPLAAPGLRVTLAAVAGAAFVLLVASGVSSFRRARREARPAPAPAPAPAANPPAPSATLPAAETPDGPDRPDTPDAPTGEVRS